MKAENGLHPSVAYETDAYKEACNGFCDTNKRYLSGLCERQGCDLDRTWSFDTRFFSAQAQIQISQKYALPDKKGV